MATATRPLPRAALREPDHGPRVAKRSWAVRLEYWAATSLLALLRALPLPGVYRAAEAVLKLVYSVSPRFRKRSLANLEIAFGAEQSPEWRERLLDAAIPYLAWSFADIILAPRLFADPRYENGVDVEEVSRALRAGGVLERSGALLVGSHQGGPEVASLAAARAGWPHAVIARPLDNPLLWKALLDDREAFPRQALTKAGALRTAYRILKERGIVGLQLDQDAGDRGVFVPYFGTLASTHTGPAMLALLSGVPVYMIFAIRTAPRRFRYKLYCNGPITVEPSGDRDRDVLRLTELMTEEIERMARRFPEQVLWAHRRWKTRPPEETAAGR